MRDAAVLLLANRGCYLQHSCANTATFMSPRASQQMPDARTQPDRESEMDVHSTILRLAQHARQMHKEGQLNMAMHEWWTLHVISQACALSGRAIEDRDSTRRCLHQ